MQQEWTNKLNTLIHGAGNFAKINPPVSQAFHQLEAATRQKRLLDDKTHELISLAVAVTTRCDGCIAVHAKKAIDLGVTREEIAEALSVAISLNAGAALTYTARVLEAVDTLPNQ